MSFLKNTWYCAGWSEDIKDKPKAIRLLDEPVVLFRKRDDTIGALEDRCPHRFAPLSLGKVQDDGLACGYHGLVFASDGQCVYNPQGNGTVPQGCSVKSYPCVVKNGAIWIWMGQADKANPENAPDIGRKAVEAPNTVIRGALKVNSHYEMLTDNLLDLGHVPYLHAFLAPAGELPPEFKEVRKVESQGDKISAFYWKHHAPISPLYKMLWDEAPDYGTTRGHMHWQPPSLLELDTGFSATSGKIEDGVCLPQAHLVTPETENTCHYFWMFGRNMKTDDQEMSEKLRTQITNVFANEDEPMVKACAENMDTTDLLALEPIFLKADVASVRARKRLKELIKAESEMN